MESQAAHWQAYNANLADLTERTSDIEGLSELINSFADGSPQSVAMIAGMAGATDERLTEMVDSWQALQAEQDAVSHSIAELATDFCNGMGEIESRMHYAINNMNMENDAAAAARATASAYVQAFADEIRGLNAIVISPGVSAPTPSSPMPAYATGTLSAAPGLALVGERGPELVNFRGGEAVHTATQTNGILSKLSVGASKAMSALASFLELDNLIFDDDGGFDSKPRPIDNIRKIKDGDSFGRDGDFYYYASPIQIDGSGLSADEIKAVIAAALEEERAKMERLWEEKQAREWRLSNA
jgi:hypothetical protein